MPSADRAAPEFHRPLALGRIGPEGRDEAIEARPAERDALARRFGIPAVRGLRALVRLRPEPDGTILADVRLDAEVTQTCVVTLEPVDQAVGESRTVRLLPPGREPADGPDDLDEIAADAHGMVDLGELVAEQLSLALDPYPRAPGASLPEEAGDAGAAPEEKPNPFAALAALRRR
jgi:uncharacterized metal-binding protein YceD (DUF177 family)